MVWWDMVSKLPVEITVLPWGTHQGQMKIQEDARMFLFGISNWHMPSFSIAIGALS